jgi:hypothetical protein
MEPQLLALAALLGVVGWLAWHVGRSPYNLRIVVKGGRVDYDARHPAWQRTRGAVLEFFRLDMPEVRDARVVAHWNGRRLRLTGDGLSRGQLQRLRNYLLSVL